MLLSTRILYFLDILTWCLFVALPPVKTLVFFTTLHCLVLGSMGWYYYVLPHNLVIRPIRWNCSFMFFPTWKAVSILIISSIFFPVPMYRIMHIWWYSQGYDQDCSNRVWVLLYPLDPLIWIILLSKLRSIVAGLSSC